MKKLLDPSLFALIKIMDLIGDALKKGGGQTLSYLRT